MRRRLPAEESFHRLHGEIHPILRVRERKKSILRVEPPGIFVFDINNDRQRRDGVSVVERPPQRIQQQQVSSALAAEGNVTGQAAGSV